MQALTSHGNLPVYEIGLPSKLCWRVEILFFNPAYARVDNSTAVDKESVYFLSGNQHASYISRTVPGKHRSAPPVIIHKYGDLRVDSGCSQGKMLLKRPVHKVPFPETVFYKGKKYVESNRKQNR